MHCIAYKINGNVPRKDALSTGSLEMNYILCEIISNWRCKRKRK
jgi:hypothetical protein